MGGCIPIYWGTSQVLEWFNPKAFLYLDEDTPEAMDALIEKVKKINEDDDLYNKMRSEPLVLGDIPQDMNLDVWKTKVHTYLKNNGRSDLYV